MGLENFLYNKFYNYINIIINNIKKKYVDIEIINKLKENPTKIYPLKFLQHLHLLIPFFPLFYFRRHGYLNSQTPIICNFFSMIFYIYF